MRLHRHGIFYKLCTSYRLLNGREGEGGQKTKKKEKEKRNEEGEEEEKEIHSRMPSVWRSRLIGVINSDDGFVVPSNGLRIHA